MRNRCFRIIIMATAGYLNVAFSGYADHHLKDAKFGFMGYTEFGEVVGGKYVAYTTVQDFGPGKVYLPKQALNFKAEAKINDRLKIVLQPEVQIWYPTFVETWAEKVKLGSWRLAPHYSVFIQNGYVQYSFGNQENPPLSMTLGSFLYKYNNEAKNLGEFLFRSGAYPGYLVNEYDFPYARLSGIHLNSTLFGGFRQDLLFTAETQITPLSDWSLSYIAGYNARKILDVAAGVSFWRIVPAVDSLTTPRYKKQMDNIYYNEKGDTCFYSFSGTKLMARATLDIKPFFGGLLDGILGSNDLKLYGEGAVLGLKNYYPYKDTLVNADSTGAGGTTNRIRDNKSAFYDSLWQRIPVMVGINLPAFKLFDLFAVQFEYYGSRFPNKYYRKTINDVVSPVPGTGNGADVTPGPYSLDSMNYHIDDWKWSINLEKTVVRGFTLKAQIARDHIRPRMDSQDRAFLDETEMMTKPSNWYWMVKAQYEF